MTPKQTKKLINKTAKAVRKEFAKLMPKDENIIVIEWGIPYVGVKLPDGTEYFFQGEEASEMLTAAVETSNTFQTSVEDTILFLSQSW